MPDRPESRVISGGLCAGVSKGTPATRRCASRPSRRCAGFSRGHRLRLRQDSRAWCAAGSSRTGSPPLVEPVRPRSERALEPVHPRSGWYEASLECPDPVDPQTTSTRLRPAKNDELVALVAVEARESSGGPGPAHGVRTGEFADLAGRRRPEPGRRVGRRRAREPTAGTRSGHAQKASPTTARTTFGSSCRLVSPAPEDRARSTPGERSRSSPARSLGRQPGRSAGAGRTRIGPLSRPDEASAARRGS